MRIRAIISCRSTNQNFGPINIIVCYLNNDYMCILIHRVISFSHRVTGLELCTVMATYASLTALRVATLIQIH